MLGPPAPDVGTNDMGSCKLVLHPTRSTAGTEDSDATRMACDRMHLRCYSNFTFLKGK